MSNSIWKTGDPTYNPDRSGDDIIMEYHRKDGSKFYVVGSCGETNDRWAYLKDIIAQADKAERLQKAVDLAVHSFNEICAGVPSDMWVFDEATKATNEIKQLIKEN